MEFHLLGARELEAAFDRVVAKEAEAARTIVAECAALVEGKAKRLAPVVRGTLRRSIRHDPIRSDGFAGASTRVGPSVIYARRIELGFRGADSLGRVYDQGGDPYFTPAVEESREAMAEIAHKHWSRVAL